MGLRRKQIEMGINHLVQPIGFQEPEVQRGCFLGVSKNLPSDCFSYERIS